MKWPWVPRGEEEGVRAGQSGIKLMDYAAAIVDLWYQDFLGGDACSVIVFHSCIDFNPRGM